MPSTVQRHDLIELHHQIHGFPSRLFTTWDWNGALHLHRFHQRRFLTSQPNSEIQRQIHETTALARQWGLRVNDQAISEPVPQLGQERFWVPLYLFIFLMPLPWPGLIKCTASVYSAACRIWKPSRALSGLWWKGSN